MIYQETDTFPPFGINCANRKKATSTVFFTCPFMNWASKQKEGWIDDKNKYLKNKVIYTVSTISIKTSPRNRIALKRMIRMWKLHIHNLFSQFFLSLPARCDGTWLSVLKDFSLELAMMCVTHPVQTVYRETIVNSVSWKQSHSKMRYC